ncbi:hypothetical protein [Salinilacihabitans rarus]|uniref:hypothetical protein n=1 Tax=Salinilacihabitans rarus TaxID=2961596 RepID=UPI0020C8CD29|nr:hypothetical protein [Salinilacihabitans rarus]
MSDSDDRLERLEELARERWGENWAIEQTHWADGTTSEHVYHMRGPVDVEGIDGRVLEKDLLVLDDEGRHVVERVRMQTGTTVDREVVSDPYDLVDESVPFGLWATGHDGQWHRVVELGTDEVTLACGEVLKEAKISRRPTDSQSGTDDSPVERCNRCLQAEHDG